jgi:hypothetical protein
MAKWSNQIPYRDRSDPLSAVGELANTLGSDEDCAVARQLVIHGVMAGLSTAGELIDRVVGVRTTSLAGRGRSHFGMSNSGPPTTTPPAGSRSPTATRAAACAGSTGGSAARPAGFRSTSSYRATADCERRFQSAATSPTPAAPRRREPRFPRSIAPCFPCDRRLMVGVRLNRR